MLQDVYTIADLRAWPAVTAGEQPPLRLAVIGDPVAHSRSPQMHNAALRASGIPAAYTRLHIAAADLPEALRLLPASGFIGANITIPHKAAVLPFLHQTDPSALRTGAVNTIVIQGEKLLGFSTDGSGFSRAIHAEFARDLHSLRILLLGAGGGAGRAIAMQCALEKCQRLLLVNRTFARAKALAAELQSDFPPGCVQPIPWSGEALVSELPEIDLIVNATPLGMTPSLLDGISPIPATLLSSRHLVYDTVYTVPRTPLLAAAALAGASVANGLSMLLHQGALSFEHWFHRPAPVEVMRASLLS